MITPETGDGSTASEETAGRNEPIRADSSHPDRENPSGEEDPPEEEDTSAAGEGATASGEAATHNELVPAEPTHRDGDAPTGEEDAPSEEEVSEEAEHIASLVFARIENKLEQHLHTEMEMPDPDRAAELREKAPEIYELWINIAQQKADAEAYVQSAQYQVPERLARSGRPWAMSALLIVLGFCAFIATLGGGAVYVAGIVAALDVVAMLGLFLGYRPELTSESKRSNAKLPPGKGTDISSEQNPED